MNKINPKTLDFLENLAENNNREWFNENKSLYLQAKLDFENIVDVIISQASEFDASIKKLEAKNCGFRIYRDTRFSKDKTPYKINMGASLAAKGTKTLSNAGYYIHMEPQKSFVAGGVYITENKNLKAIREKISSESKRFLDIINKKSFAGNLELQGEKLAKVPQGFSKENPMSEYLKYKQFTVIHPISDQELLSDNFITKVVNVFKEIYPFNCFLNEAIVGI